MSSLPRVINLNHQTKNEKQSRATRKPRKQRIMFNQNLFEMVSKATALIHTCLLNDTVEYYWEILSMLLMMIMVLYIFICDDGGIFTMPTQI